MIVTPIKTRLFIEHEDLVAFIVEHLPTVPERSVIVVTSKIVALAEGNTRIIETEDTREETIREESDFAIRTKYTWLTLKDGLLMSSAGIDESNADGKLILLPKDSFVSAKQLRSALMAHYGVRELGILIPDSRVLPLRAGAVGVAMGYAGFTGIRDYRGTPDLFGRPFKVSRANIPDALSAAAVLVMGEGTECHPLALVSDAPVVFVDTVERDELRIPPEDDLYRPFFDALPKESAEKPLPEA